MTGVVSMTSQNGSSCADVTAYVADLSFKKCWTIIQRRTSHIERLWFYAETIAGTTHGPEVVAALAADRGVSERQARKWLHEKNAKPKKEFAFFVELMDHFDDDWRAAAVALHQFKRGGVFDVTRRGTK